MKNSVVFIGIALVSLVDVCNAYGSVDQNQDSSPIVFEAIDSVKTSKVEKTSDELIAEDNAITGNNISNETYALDFTFINSHSMVDEVIESVNDVEVEKTTEELIAEDNAITGNDFSNETRALDFNLINSNSNLSAVNHKPLFSKRQKS